LGSRQTLFGPDSGTGGGAVSERTVTIEVNQQQEQMLERLIAEGEHGANYGEVIRRGFVLFCEQHPELLGEVDDDRGGTARDG
jgi:hypothetical protein